MARRLELLSTMWMEIFKAGFNGTRVSGSMARSEHHHPSANADDTKQPSQAHTSPHGDVYSTTTIPPVPTATARLLCSLDLRAPRSVGSVAVRSDTVLN